MKSIKQLLLAGLLAIPTAAVPADTKPNVIVEPFLASWCAKSFPDQLTEFDAYSMVEMMDSGKHVKIEPFIGRWCFEQFPELDVLDENEAIGDLFDNHKQLEPFLEEWGKNSMQLVTDGADNHLIDVEPYIGAWCAEQFPQALEDLKPTIYVDVQDNHVKFEPSLSRWCFASFPEQLSSLDEDATVEEIKNDHKLVENELMMWMLTTNSAKPMSDPKATGSSSSGSSGKGKAAIITLSILAALCLLGLVLVTSCRNKKEYDTA